MVVVLLGLQTSSQDVLNVVSFAGAFLQLFL